MAQEKLRCVHSGCGKEYTDPEEVCRYHPGPPVFHEGQKGMYMVSTSSPFSCGPQLFEAPFSAWPGALLS